MHDGGVHVFGFFITNSIIVLVIIGLVAGWLAGKVTRGRGFGCLADILLGLIGAFIGSWLFAKLHIIGSGLLYSVAAATVGAVLLVAIAHLLSGHRND